LLAVFRPTGTTLDRQNPYLAGQKSAKCVGQNARFFFCDCAAKHPLNSRVEAPLSLFCRRGVFNAPD
jgi:hypothetical protein